MLRSTGTSKYNTDCPVLSCNLSTRGRGRDVMNRGVSPASTTPTPGLRHGTGSEYQRGTSTRCGPLPQRTWLRYQYPVPVPGTHVLDLVLQRTYLVHMYAAAEQICTLQYYM